MASFSSLSLQIFFLTNLTNMSQGTGDLVRSKTAVMRLSDNCKPSYLRLDNYDEVELTSNTWPLPNTEIQANTTCLTHFITGNPDQGICVHHRDLFFSHPGSGIELRIYTTKLGPEKAFNHQHYKFNKWCTEQSTISIELTTARNFLNQNGEYRFNFLISNVSKEDISKEYHMDTYKECDMSYILTSGEEIMVAGQRYPALDDLPSNCLLTFSTSSKEEYEELCLHIEKVKTVENCLSSLVINGFNSRFWPESEVLGCNDSQPGLVRREEMCSSAKTLTFNLTRSSTADTGVIFTAVVRVKKHPYWEVVANEQQELRGLGFVKGLTFFIATINSLAGIMGAVLATMFRNPRSFWKNWAESMNAAQKCEAIHYEAAYPEVSCSQAEEITEAKSY